MKLTEFVERNARISAATGRVKETIVREVLRACEPQERITAALFLCGKLAHPTEPYTTGIKETFIANDLAIEGQNSHEAMEPVILERAGTKGDYDLADVWAVLRSYLESGNRTKAEKSRIITICLQDMPTKPQDAVFLLRLLTGKMGNGVDARTVLHAYCSHLCNDRNVLSRLYSFNPSIATWIWAADNPDDFEERHLLLKGTATPGVPMEPQLCARVQTLDDVFKEGRTKVLAQTKLDGMRVHIHLVRERQDRKWVRNVRFFTRELKDITEGYQELFSCFRAMELSKEAILDGELVALDEGGNVAPFDILQKRLGRKVGRTEYRVGIVLYDVLLHDEADIPNMTYAQRLKLLHDLTFPDPRLQVISSDVVTESSTLEDMLRAAAERGEEGLVVKDPNSLAKPGARDRDWIKLKGDYLGSDFGDSYDLVVVGYNHGRGRRHGTIGAVWCAASDGTTVCKVGTGFTDEDLAWLKEYFAPIDNTDGRYGGMDVVVDPSLVIEVKAAQVSKDQDGNLSLRFPRYIRRREDKEPASATTMQEIREALRA